MIMVLCLPLYHCKPKSNKKGSVSKSFNQTASIPEEKPVLLFPKLEDTACTEEKALKNLGEVEITMYDAEQEKYEIVKKDLSKLKGNPISGDFISEVNIGYHELRNLSGCENLRSSNQKSRFFCKNSQITKKEIGTKVSLCKKKYKQDSLENHILAGVYSVSKTFECVAKLGLKVNPLLLRFYPKIEVIVPAIEAKKDLSYFKSDNAFWAYFTGYGEETLNFLPHSLGKLNESAYTKEAFDLSEANKSKKSSSPLDYQFTLNESVSSHEAGHHVFDHMARPSLSIIQHQIRGGGYETHDVSTAMNKNLLVYNALNEGMADAVSYLCFFNNTTAEVRFKGGEQEKILTQEKIDTLLGTGGSKAKSNPHTVGAIILNGLQEYWKTIGTDVTEGGDESNPENKETFDNAKKLLFKGMENVGEILAGNDPVEYLSDAILALTKGSQEKNTKESCDVLKKYFPVNYKQISGKLSCGGKTKKESKSE